MSQVLVTLHLMLTLHPEAVSLQNANSADSLLQISEGVPLGGAVRGCHPPQLDTLQCL